VFAHRPVSESQYKNPHNGKSESRPATKAILDSWRDRTGHIANHLKNQTANKSPP